MSLSLILSCKSDQANIGIKYCSSIGYCFVWLTLSQEETTTSIKINTDIKGYTA